MSMKDYSTNYRDYTLSVQRLYTDVWDADKLYGCVCDFGYYGYDCSLRDCPRGDDPLTKGQVNEIQYLLCQANSGKFALSFGPYVTPMIDASAQALVVKAALESLPNINGVTVSYSVGTSVCQTTRLNVVKVEFTQNFGAQPRLVPITTSLPTGSTFRTSGANGQLTDSTGTIFTSVTGTKENSYCSSRGSCSSSEGFCSCYSSNGDSYASSDGYAGSGIRGDCGRPLTSTASCPGELACSGHGVCTKSTYSCKCSQTWQGGDCSERVCPSGLSWFNYPTAANTAHNVYSECSDMGTCDRTAGTCSCKDGYFGDACEKMVCGGGAGNACSGHGACLSMYDLAVYADNNGDATDFTYGLDPNNAYTWDAKRIHGCLCDPTWGTYDCSLRTCPLGDDPATYDDVQEVQAIQCTAVDGTMTLTFRQKTTSAISFDATASQVKTALEALTTIDSVDVEYTTGTTLCTSDGTNTATVKFFVPSGDVPPMTFDTSLLRLSSLVDVGSGTPVILAADGCATGVSTGLCTYSVKGTTESVECSNRGLCDTDTGECACFTGWTSSDGRGGSGQRPDCGHRIPKYGGPVTSSEA